MWLYCFGRFHEGRRALCGRRLRCATRSTRGSSPEEFKRQSGALRRREARRRRCASTIWAGERCAALGEAGPRGQAPAPRAADGTARGVEAARARARERAAADGGRCFKTSGADIRTKVTVIAADARRYPVSARCRILGVPRSTYYHMLAHPPRPKAPEPISRTWSAPSGPAAEYGARRLKIVLARSGVVASRRRICRIMRENGLASAYSGRAPRGGRGPAQPPSAGNVLARRFDGHPRAPPGGRPHLRPRRRLVVLRLPPGRPVQPRDRRQLVRAAQGRAPGQGGVLERGLPARRSRDVPQRRRVGVLQRGDRRAALGLRHREVGFAPPATPTTTQWSSRRTGCSSESWCGGAPSPRRSI